MQKKIKSIDDDIKEMIKILKNDEEAKEKCRIRYSEFENEMSELIKYIEEKRKSIEDLSHDKITLEEARARLEEKRSTTSQ